MAEEVNIAEAQNKFSEYPEEMDKYFADKKLIIKAIPIRYKMVSEPEFSDIVITSAKQYIDFIDNELKFWDDKDTKKIRVLNDYYNKLISAQNYFNNSQEQRIEEIKNKNIEAVKKLEEESKTYFDQKEKRCADLENLYENKLRIEKPADYWKQMHNMYSKKGKLWFGSSCGVAIAIVAMLICILAFVPNVFDEQSHWFDILKNSAIVTVVAGVAIYVLRIFVKMALSSFHLARDAKEREQLSYYYLSLIQGKAITDRERALIINSLFSRSDTGLLKGDAAPAMTTNIADIIETVTKK